MRIEIKAIASVMVLLACGCIDNGEDDPVDIDPKEVVIDLLYYLNAGLYSDASSLLIGPDGEFLKDDGGIGEDLLHKMDQVYGADGENITIFSTDFQKESEEDNGDHVLHRFEVELGIPMSYQWADGEGIFEFKVAEFKDTGSYGILVDDGESPMDALMVLPLNPNEGDLELEVHMEKNSFYNGTSDIPVNISITNVRDFPVLIEHPPRMALGIILYSPNGTRIYGVVYDDRAIYYSYLEAGDEVAYTEDIADKGLSIKGEKEDFNWDIPGEYSLQYYLNSYGLSGPTYLSNELTITIEESV